MSTDKCNDIVENNQTVTWNLLIKATEDRLLECQCQIQKLTKSLIYFKKQEVAKIPFPLKSKDS